jgi:hypothetical protein
MGWSCASADAPEKIPRVLGFTVLALVNTAVGAAGETVLLPYDLVIQSKPAKQWKESCEELLGNERPPAKQSPPV